MTATIHPKGCVLVTGAGGGLGAEIALALALRGVEPALLGRTAERLQRVAADILEQTGIEAVVAPADIIRFRAVEDAVDTVLRTGRQLRGVVNNAGTIDPIATIETADPNEWATSINVNLTGAFHVLRATLPHLGADSVVLNISSGAATTAHAGWGAYSAAKAGLEQLTNTLAAERPDLRVHAFRPGTLDTTMQATIRSSTVDNDVRRLPQTALRPPSWAAAAAAWLVTTPGAVVHDRIITAATIHERHLHADT